MVTVRLAILATVPIAGPDLHGGRLAGMTDGTRKIKYSGDLMSMRKLIVCLQEEGLQVTVERSEERRDITATIMAILAIVGGADAVIDLTTRIKTGIRKYRELNPGSDDIEVLEPDDGGFLDE